MAPTGQSRAGPGLRRPPLPRTRDRRDTRPAAPRAPGGPRETDGSGRGTNCHGARALLNNAKAAVGGRRAHGQVRGGG